MGMKNNLAIWSLVISVIGVLFILYSNTLGVILVFIGSLAAVISLLARTEKFGEKWCAVASLAITVVVLIIIFSA